MNIIIDTIRVAGFRGIKSLEMSLSRVTVLIGTNNSGKTSVLKALQLALGDYSRYLSEEDFHIGVDEKRVQEMLVDIRIIPVDGVGKRKQLFDDEWVIEFEDKIKAEANGNQFLALRTRCKSDLIKGGFDTSRFVLEKWSGVDIWQTEKAKETKMNNRFLGLPFISIEAQRDIHQELKEKSSFVGKVLSSVVYDDADVKELESLIKAVNDEAVNKSGELQGLKTHLDNLNQSFQGSGSAEITPFPKKIRDLTKHFSINFGESAGNSFSMEYHGMGTRSWASMLTVIAFAELMVEKHKQEEKPFFPILATEEPEAHLHPNAQKTIYHQLTASKGQVIMSTHSPYLAAMADQSELRYLKKNSGGIAALQLNIMLGDEDRRRIQREVMHSRGEILFSKALVLCEGETEEQALPMLFQKYFDNEAFVLGVSFIGVGGSGKKYLPFLTFAKDFSIPVFVFSDGEDKISKDLKKVYDSVFGETDITTCPYITILDGVDFEEYLLSSGFKSCIEDAISQLDGANAVNDWILENHGKPQKGKKTKHPPCTTCNQPISIDILRDYQSSDGYDKALKDMLDKGKTKYAPVVAERLCELELSKFPPKIIELFEKIKAGAEL
ncbi:MAG: AAA family ATPase [Gallionella sp.]|nr:AAA family ATPase [Gallionella sp.]